MSLLPHVTKVIERIIYINKLIFTCQVNCKNIKLDFENHMEHSALDKEKNICVLFMDLSKAFDTINHDLLLAKLKAYGFSTNALDVMCSCLKNRKQSVQINNNFSSGKKGFIHGPLLFNLFINDSVLFLTDTFLSNYADDNNLYSIGKDCDIIKNLLRKDFMALTEWFFEKMSLNAHRLKYRK